MAGSGALLTPEATVSTRPSKSPRSSSADFQRPSLFVSPALLSDPESCRDEASARVHHIHPSGLPLTCNTQSEWAPLGFSLSFAPGNYSPRTSGRGPVSDTDRKLRLGHQTRPPIDVLTHFVRPRVAPHLGRCVRESCAPGLGVRSGVWRAASGLMLAPPRREDLRQYRCRDRPVALGQHRHQDRRLNHDWPGT
jgi:hypothetical protein